jgi:cyclic pyranopterin phosphate synthase
MPSEQVTFRPKRELLTFEEIVRLTRVVAGMGVNRLRLTGGEPLVRAGLSELIRQLAGIAGIEDIALTTNGLLLSEQAAALRTAGLKRLNVSLDCLDDDVFFRISRRRGIQRVVDGILAAKAVGFSRIRINSVVIPSLNDYEIVKLAAFAREHKLELRFIEFMPLNSTGQWEMGQVLSGGDIRNRIEEAFGPLRPVADADPHQPARDFDYCDGGGRIGFVNSVTEPFCAACNRLRLMADGQLRNCLFSDVGWDVRALLRNPHSTDDDIRKLIRDCVRAKWAGHGIQTEDFIKPQRAMYEIGG